MTDWWSTTPVRQNGDERRQEWQAQARQDMERVAASGEDLSQEPDDWGYDAEGNVTDLRRSSSEPGTASEPRADRPDRRKALILGAAGAAVAGALVFTMMPDGAATSPTASSGAPADSQGDFLPPAGGGASEAAQDRSNASVAPSPKKVTLTATPDGTGSVGALVRLTIHNGTDEAVIVMSSMVKGDGSPAVIGEGTLAPGSRRIEPDETAVGTVEFAAKKAPAQIVLVDLGGNVVAGSG